MNVETIVITVVGAILGGSGIVGLAFAYIRRFIDRRLSEKELANAKRKDIRLKRLMVDDEWYHCAGRFLFYIHKFIQTGEHNGDFEEAWKRFLIAEEKKKALDREIMVENEWNY